MPEFGQNPAEIRRRAARAVSAERDRRIALGHIVTLSSYGDIPVQGRPQDQINLLALKDTARDMVDAGVTEPVIPFRDGDNVHHLLTPAQMIEIADQGKRAASAIYAAAWALKAYAPIPEDFADDHHWPGSTEEIS